MEKYREGDGKRDKKREGGRVSKSERERGGGERERGERKRLLFKVHLNAAYIILTDSPFIKE